MENISRLTPPKSKDYRWGMRRLLFKITLPIAQTVKQQSTNTVLKTSFKGKKALIVEDNELNSEIISIILNQYDMDVDIATNGKEALEQFQQTKPFTYDIIFMDIMMPIMNGLEATQKIRALDREDHNLPIYAMSANAFLEDEKRSIESGMNGHLSKPLDTQKLSIRSFKQRTRLTTYWWFFRSNL